MKLKKQAAAPRVERDRYNAQQQIRLYGEDNKYPQEIRGLIKASRTATSCLNTLSKFIRGAGFASDLLNKISVGKRTKLFKLHSQIAGDLAAFRGFAVHVGYNGLLDEISYTLVPFEHCRIHVDKDKNPTGLIAVHPDWDGSSGKPFKKDDIVYLNQYTADRESVKKLIIDGEGFSKFKGLIYFYSDSADAYPESVFDPVRELMTAQAAADNIRVRNVKFNFLPSGILYKLGCKERLNGVEEGDGKEGAEDSSEFAESVEKWQGDDNAAKMLVIEQEFPEEDLKFVEFPQKNMDKFSENTDKQCDEGIRSYMGIPPELLGREGSRGFSAETMKDAYTFYNAITDSERMTLEEAYAEVFGNLAAKNGVAEIKILPLKYGV